YAFRKEILWNGERQFQVIYNDITDRKRISEEFQRLANRSRDIIYRYDLTTRRFVFVNNTYREFYGMDVEGGREVTTKSVLLSLHPEDRDKVKKARDESLAPGSTGGEVEYRQIRPDGSLHWMHDRWSVITDETGNPVILEGIIRDNTEHKRLEEEMREMSFRDQLTELYNRRGFITLTEQQLKAANRAQRPMRLTFIDYDDLKWINDTLGHEEGDKALVDTANVLRQTFRESDIVARIGGDEFAVLSIDATDMNPEAFSKRLQQRIDEYNEKESRPYKLAMSWGTAIYDPESPMSLDKLMSSADDLMYAQKKSKSSRRV
ncbi:MAG: sensor domain-containing diguanylate cyclase, partial [Proteobacteria bacterium]|nr:sensor domain-containing diguanylate cyclase [Pseudomonadota bacterium]